MNKTIGYIKDPLWSAEAYWELTLKMLDNLENTVKMVEDVLKNKIFLLGSNTIVIFERLVKLTTK